MLPKIHRPTTKSVYYLMRYGKRRYGRYLTIQRISGQQRARRGVHIAKKTARQAVQRNSAKRAVFTVIQEKAGDVSDGLFFVTVNKKNTHNRDSLIQNNTTHEIYEYVHKAVDNDVQCFIKRYKKQKRI